MWHPSPTLWTGTTGPRTITANHDLLYPNQWWKWFKVTGPYPLSLFLHWNGECLSHGALNTATILSHALLRPFYTSSNTRSSQGHAFFTFKASLAAISACHVGWNGAQYVQDSFTHPLATDFMKGTKHLQPPHSVLCRQHCPASHSSSCQILIWSCYLSRQHSCWHWCQLSAWGISLFYWSTQYTCSILYHLSKILRYLSAWFSPSHLTTWAKVCLSCQSIECINRAHHLQ